MAHGITQHVLVQDGGKVALAPVPLPALHCGDRPGTVGSSLEGSCALLGMEMEEKKRGGGEGPTEYEVPVSGLHSMHIAVYAFVDMQVYVYAMHACVLQGGRASRCHHAGGPGTLGLQRNHGPPTYLGVLVPRQPSGSGQARVANG